MGICMSKECISEYREKLEAGIQEYMKLPVSQRTAEAVDGMVEAWVHVKAMEDMISKEFEFNMHDAMEWNEKMINEDGTIGGHWTVEETSGLGVPEGVSEWCWNVTMNMMYSDYEDVADRHGVGTAEFYADMAKAFLFDKDSGKTPHQKIAAYHAMVID